MSTEIKIVIVDDNKQFLSGLRIFLANYKNINIIAQFNSGDELLKNIHNFNPDIILLDIEMPGLNGFETAIRINTLRHRIKLIATTMYQDIVYLSKLIEHGFKGFVSKPNIPEDLVRTIDEVYNDRFYFPANIIKK